MNLLSYHNDPSIKLKYQQRFEAHRKADEVIQGTGFDSRSNRGCFVGCTLDNYDHSQFPVELGIPEWLAHLADSIFEGLPKGEAPQFGTDLLEAIPVGVDLNPVKWKLSIWRHTQQLEYVTDEKVRRSLDLVIDYCQDQLSGTATEEQRIEVREIARSAADWTTESVAESAYWTARSAESAASVAESVAESARSAYSSAESARSAYWSAERDQLLSILRELG